MWICPVHSTIGIRHRQEYRKVHKTYIRHIFKNTSRFHTRRYSIYDITIPVHVSRNESANNQNQFNKHFGIKVKSVSITYQITSRYIQYVLFLVSMYIHVYSCKCIHIRTVYNMYMYNVHVYACTCTMIFIRSMQWQSNTYEIQCVSYGKLRKIFINFS